MGGARASRTSGGGGRRCPAPRRWPRPGRGRRWRPRRRRRGRRTAPACGPRARVAVAGERAHDARPWSTSCPRRCSVPRTTTSRSGRAAHAGPRRGGRPLVGVGGRQADPQAGRARGPRSAGGWRARSGPGRRGRRTRRGPPARRPGSRDDGGRVGRAGHRGHVAGGGGRRGSRPRPTAGPGGRPGRRRCRRGRGRW